MTQDTSASAPRTPRPGRTPLDQLFAVLSDPHRRRILVALAERTPGAFAQADLVAGIEDRERFAVELHHVHLPLLQTAGYIEWDPATETIRPGPEYTEIVPCLGLLSANADDLPGVWP